MSWPWTNPDMTQSKERALKPGIKSGKIKRVQLRQKQAQLCVFCLVIGRRKLNRKKILTVGSSCLCDSEGLLRPHIQCNIFSHQLYHSSEYEQRNPHMCRFLWLAGGSHSILYVQILILVSTNWDFQISYLKIGVISSFIFFCSFFSFLFNFF